MITTIKRKTFAEAYQELLSKLMLCPDFECAPRDQKIKELISVSLEIEDPLSVLFQNNRRSSPKKYIANELILYFAGLNSANAFSKHAKLGDSIKNSDGTVNSAYGHLIFSKLDCRIDKPASQGEGAKYSLQKDADTRQALLHFNTPVHQYSDNKDFVCTLYAQFFIRESKLYLIYAMRSSDGHLGIVSDLPGASSMLQCMNLELQDVYPGLKLGSLLFTMNSSHIYERNFPIISEMLEHEFRPESMPLFETSPILSKDIFALYNEEKVDTKDSFINWLQDNK